MELPEEGGSWGDLHMFPSHLPPLPLASLFLDVCPLQLHPEHSVTAT